MIDDPLAILVPPRETMDWLVETGRVKKAPFLNHEQLKAESRVGKFVINQLNHRLNGFFDSEEAARARIDEIVGNKRSALKEYHTFTVAIIKGEITG